MRNGIKVLLIIAVVTFLWSGQALASQIGTLFNTGVDSSGAVLSGGSVDPHYTILTTSPAYVFDGGYPIGPWISNQSNSRWIAPTLDTYAGYTYTYETTFNLKGFDPTTASIRGWAASDDNAIVYLNGNLNSAIDVSGFVSTHGFSFTSGFVPGINTLDFVVTNGGGGPTGLQVNMAGTANAVPIPAAAWLLGSGLIGLVGIRRKIKA